MMQLTVSGSRNGNEKSRGLTEWSHEPLTAVLVVGQTTDATHCMCPASSACDGDCTAPFSCSAVGAPPPRPPPSAVAVAAPLLLARLLRLPAASSAAPDACASSAASSSDRPAIPGTRVVQLFRPRKASCSAALLVNVTDRCRVQFGGM